MLCFQLEGMERFCLAPVESGTALNLSLDSTRIQNTRKASSAYLTSILERWTKFLTFYKRLAYFVIVISYIFNSKAGLTRSEFFEPSGLKWWTWMILVLCQQGVGVTRMCCTLSELTQMAPYLLGPSKDCCPSEMTVQFKMASTQNMSFAVQPPDEKGCQ